MTNRLALKILARRLVKPHFVGAALGVGAYHAKKGITKKQASPSDTKTAVTYGVVGGLGQAALSEIPNAKRRVIRFHNAAVHGAFRKIEDMVSVGGIQKDKLPPLRDIPLPARAPMALEKVMHPFRAARAGRILKAKDARYIKEFGRFGIKL